MYHEAQTEISMIIINECFPLQCTVFQIFLKARLMSKVRQCVPKTMKFEIYL
jgi:hypothetical protein